MRNITRNKGAAATPKSLGAVFRKTSKNQLKSCPAKIWQNMANDFFLYIKDLGAIAMDGKVVSASFLSKVFRTVLAYRSLNPDESCPFFWVGGSASSGPSSENSPLFYNSGEESRGLGVE
jgi:hypothetical protein